MSKKNKPYTIEIKNPRPEDKPIVMFGRNWRLPRLVHTFTFFVKSNSQKR